MIARIPELRRGPMPRRATADVQAARELLATALRRWLEHVGWSQSQLAAALGVGPKTVSDWCRGATAIPAARIGQLVALGFAPPEGA